MLPWPVVAACSRAGGDAHAMAAVRGNLSEGRRIDLRPTLCRRAGGSTGELPQALATVECESGRAGIVLSADDAVLGVVEGSTCRFFSTAELVQGRVQRLGSSLACSQDIKQVSPSPGQRLGWASLGRARDGAPVCRTHGPRMECRLPGTPAVKTLLIT